MTDGKWGHCQHCKYFGSPARAPLVNEEARCEEPNLSHYHLTVFGANGCNAFELRPGLSPQIEDPRHMVAS